MEMLLSDRTLAVLENVPLQVSGISVPYLAISITSVLKANCQQWYLIDTEHHCVYLVCLFFLSSFLLRNIFLLYVANINFVLSATSWYRTYNKLHLRSVYCMFLPIYSLPFYNKMLSSQFVATHKCPHYLNMNLILFKIRHCKDQDTALRLHFSKSCLSDLLIAISEIPQR